MVSYSLWNQQSKRVEIILNSSKMCYLKYFEKKFRAREENEETRGDKTQATNQTFWRNNLTVMHGINQWECIVTCKRDSEYIHRQNRHVCNSREFHVNFTLNFSRETSVKSEIHVNTRRFCLCINYMYFYIYNTSVWPLIKHLLQTNTSMW